MSSIINATTTTGLVSSADNSGSLQLATNNGTTAVTIDTSQNVGIGTASPLTPLHVVGAIQSQRVGAAQYARMLNSGGVATFINNNQASATYAGFEFQGISTASGTPVTYAVINANGIGLGTAAPSSGTGITFPATQSASSDANTLDDYEEGTWTPVLNRDTTAPTIAYNVQSGTYVKIGSMVYCQAYFAISSISANGSGLNKITGLPFSVPAGNTRWTGAIGYNDALTSAAFFYITANSTQGFFGAAGGGNPNANYAVAQFYVSFQYQTS